jgi:exodeoxyribonuclease-3
MALIACWNVNSVRSRLEHLLAFLQKYSPDIVLLQELKALEDAFPAMEIEDMGYNLAIYGQKTYNGVAILSKYPIEDVQRGIPSYEDENARYIEAVIALPTPVRVASIYVPNGSSPDSEKFVYKMEFMQHLHRHMNDLLRYDEAIIMGGDYNIAPFANDIYDPKKLDGTICYHPKEREHLRAILNMGYYDAIRLKYPTENIYSWWDYRAGAWQGGQGYRIDHFLLSPKAVDIYQDCGIAEEFRAMQKPSDHAPLWVRVE